jgi:DNA topoisomerase III
MIVCIAEKPSVAKEIAVVLGASVRKDGYFEGNGYAVTYTFGHLCTLKEPEDYKPEHKKWKISDLPILPEKFGIKLVTDPGAVKQFKVIEKLVSAASEVINCGDAAIEGELIQRWVLTKAGCKAPVKRLWISSLTEEAIREGFKNLKPSAKYDLLYAAGNSRAVGDWLLGINATRLYTLKFAQGRGVLSIGRVQTPTLALIVYRDLEIENFVPKAYWELKTLYKNISFSSDKKKFDTPEEANACLEVCKQNLLTIKDFARKKEKELPPKLLDLTGLQVECNKKLGLSAEETLQIAQKLYEKKMLTYPRVDTVFLPSDIYPKVQPTLKGMRPYAELAAPILAGKIMKRKQVFDDSKVTDHHAIIPTGVDSSSLYGKEQQVYDMVARRFLAAFYPDAIVSNTTAKADVGGIGFKATGKQVLEPGWKELFPRRGQDTDEQQDDAEMPALEIGESGPHKPEVSEKYTAPPKPHTEASLLRAMETAGKQVEDDDLRQAMKENGIGRPSTRANIIETLFRRKYIIKNRKSLASTQTGRDLIANIKNDLLKSAELTGMWEYKLRQIEKGQFEAKLFIGEMKEMVRSVAAEVMSAKGGGIFIEQAADANKPEKKSSKPGEDKNAAQELKCPICQSKVVKGKSAYGCLGYKNGCKYVLAFEQFGKKLTDRQLEAILIKAESPIVIGLEINGAKTKGRIVMRQNGTLEAIAEKEAEKSPQAIAKTAASGHDPILCPLCKQGHILKGKQAYGCSRYKLGCNFLAPFADIVAKYGSDFLTLKRAEEIAISNR